MGKKLTAAETRDAILDAVRAQGTDIALIQQDLAGVKEAVVQNTEGRVEHGSRLAVLESQQQTDKRNWGRAWNIINTAINAIMTGVLVNKQR